ncbi:flagellar hook protein FlgE [bacterium]|nr:flagellar hook protein FlgE [bacterium]MBU1676920.1 flagellar hook protein FlgE [bacterium]
MSALHTALAGMIAHQDRMAGIADRVSRWRLGGSGSATAPVDLVKDVVEAKQILRGFQAGSSVLRTADRMTGLLLDVHA